jgi:hypothetical protein
VAGEGFNGFILSNADTSRPSLVYHSINPASYNCWGAFGAGDTPERRKVEAGSDHFGLINPVPSCTSRAVNVLLKRIYSISIQLVHTTSPRDVYKKKERERDTSMNVRSPDSKNLKKIEERREVQNLRYPLEAGVYS